MRGFDYIHKANGTMAVFTGVCKKIAFYQGYSIHHSGTIMYVFESASGFVSLGSYSAPTAQTMRFNEANDNLYMTTNNGVYKMDSYAATPKLCGVAPALDIFDVGTDAAQANPIAIPAKSCVSYRVVFGYYDANNNLILGAPSNILSVQNTTSSSISRIIGISIPYPYITSNYICQIYRSDPISSDGTVQPPDEQKLIDQLTGSQLVAADITYHDNIPYGFGGAILYTASSQQGIQNSYVPAPLALDICSFAGSQFFLNTQYRWTITIILQKISPDTLGLKQTNKFTIWNGSISTEYLHVAHVYSAGDTNPFTGLTLSPAGAIDLTAKTLVNMINDDDLAIVWAFYDSGLQDLPGQIRLEAKNLTDGQFYVSSDNATCWNDANIYAPTATPHIGGLSSSRDAFPNGVAYSLPQQPESVPAPNTFYPGSGDQPIYRGFALRDSLFILKADGIYRIYGNDPSNFQLTLMDSTAKLIAPDAACVLSNQIYALTTQGVVTISETGVTIISRPIESDILQVITTNPNISSLAFSFAYESQRAFYICLPTTAGDIACTQFYRYNLLTSAWTRGTLALSCGAVDPVANVILAGPTAGGFIYVERKSLTPYDYANYAFTTTVTVSGKVLTPASGTHLVGEVVQQSSSIWGIVTAISRSGALTIASPVGTFTNGSVDILYPIQTAITWAPQTLGSSVDTKQVREAQLIYRLDMYGAAIVGFASDLMPTMEYESVYGVNYGGWGLPAYGGPLENINGAVWGGGNRRRTLRVGVTRNHQRCQLLTVNFSQSWAYSQWQLEGLTLIGTGISERTSWDGSST
jgi:hypothetical protein